MTSDFGRLNGPSTEPPAVRVPNEATIFSARAARFEALAANHSFSGWLRLLGSVSGAQHLALQSFAEVGLPSSADLARAASHAMPPLAAQSWPRDPAWRVALPLLLDTAAPHVPSEGRGEMDYLRGASADSLEHMADRVLRTELYGEHAAALPFVAAALQVYWTHMAARVPPRLLDVPGLCPCCGFLPVASIVRSGGEGGGRRYLHCALCNTEWHLVRIKCAACDHNSRIGYRQIEGSSGAVRAECCGDCSSYLKIMYTELEPRADPVADDLATLALDILMDEAGYARAGPNLLLAPGGT